MTARSRVDELTERARRVIGAPPTPAVSQGAPPASSATRGTVADAPIARAPLASAGGLLPVDAAPQAEAVVIMGIDPGTATTGYGILRSEPEAPDGGTGFSAVDYGVIETPAGEAMPVRLLAIYRRLRELIAEHRPSQVAVEQLFFGRNTTTAISVGQARGVALLAVAEAGLPATEYTPLEVKHAIAGFGRADKHQMQRMMQTLLRLPTLPHPDDAADALAIALCHARLARVRELGLR